jgi:hypothetical protein
MPDPLPADIVARLQSDPTAALAAALILAGSFPDLVSWAMRAVGGGGASNGGGAKRARKDARAKGRPNPREGAAKRDEALLALMRANPDANVTELIRMNGRPRNSTVLSLERLEKAGLVEHARRGKWTVVDEVPAPKPWLQPLSANRVARHAADGRVREELSSAASAH